MIHISSQKLKALLPYAGALIIFFGILKNIYYYWAFNINIMSFLDFSEIITAFSNDLVYIMAVYGFVVIFTFFITTKKDDDLKAEMQNNYITIPGFWKRMKQHKYYIIAMLFLNIYFAVFYFRSPNASSVTFAKTIWIASDVQFIFILLLYEYKRKYFIHTDKVFDPSLSNIILSCFLLLTFLAGKVSLEVDNVKYWKKYKNVSFKTSTATFQSDSFHYYIGQTKNYLFYYDERVNTTTSLPMSEIKQIDFKYDVKK